MKTPHHWMPIAVVWLVVTIMAGTMAVGPALALAAQPGAAAPTAEAEHQHEFIDTTIAAFPRSSNTSGANSGADGVPALGRVFFLGFAGFGEERVFAEEIKMAARQAGARFGSASRTLLLINDRRDLTTYPLATHDNLRYALRALARTMDRERDVLFLALSSHGSQNGMIAVARTGQPELGLAASTVARFLDEAGIRWRVVVVSACFSGTFIEPLASKDSIVITAAASDRMSFGCSDERHLTYFGEAFYRDALPATASLRAAFEATSRAIRRRETEEGVTPSRPQSHFGVLMEQRLGEMVPPHMVPGEESGENGEN